MTIEEIMGTQNTNMYEETIHHIIVNSAARGQTFTTPAATHKEGTPVVRRRPRLGHTTRRGATPQP